MVFRLFYGKKGGHMDTLIRGYNKKETPPKPPVHISLGKVFNSICIGGYYSCVRTQTFMNGSATFNIPDLDLKPGESYTMSVPYSGYRNYIVNGGYDETKCRTFEVRLDCKYGGCFGNINPVITVWPNTVPKNGETKTLTTTYGNARIEFILRNNNGRWNNSIKISPK